MKWTTKDGTQIEIADMTDSHLINTIRWLQRAAESLRLADAEAAYDFGASCHGEMAQMAAFEAGDELFAIDDEQYLENREDYQEMLKEALRRKLQVGDTL